MNPDNRSKKSNRERLEFSKVRESNRIQNVFRKGVLHSHTLQRFFKPLRSFKEDGFFTYSSFGLKGFREKVLKKRRCQGFQGFEAFVAELSESWHFAVGPRIPQTRGDLREVPGIPRILSISGNGHYILRSRAACDAAATGGPITERPVSPYFFFLCQPVVISWSQGEWPKYKKNMARDWPTPEEKKNPASYPPKKKNENLHGTSNTGKKGNWWHL